MQRNDERERDRERERTRKMNHDDLMMDHGDGNCLMLCVESDGMFLHGI